MAWICLNDAFLSIVAHKTEPESLLVRARLAGDIESVFPGAKIEEGKGTDYRFRATIPRTQVAMAIMDRLLNIDYPNFKNSVKDKARSQSYGKIWQIMHAVQEAMKRA